MNNAIKIFPQLSQNLLEANSLHTVPFLWAKFHFQQKFYISVFDSLLSDACKSTRANIIDPLNPRSSPRDCYDILKLGQTESGQYDIFPLDIDGAVRVYCDMTTDGGGWTVSISFRIEFACKCCMVYNTHFVSNAAVN